MVPKTDDGRVLFAIPWHNRILVGTTDTPIASLPTEPKPLEAELDFLLAHVAAYFDKRPEPSDILSTFAGLRPLLRGQGDLATAKLSREHAVVVSSTAWSRSRVENGRPTGAWQPTPSTRQPRWAASSRGQPRHSSSSCTAGRRAAKKTMTWKSTDRTFWRSPRFSARRPSGMSGFIPGCLTARAKLCGRLVMKRRLDRRRAGAGESCAIPRRPCQHRSIAARGDTPGWRTETRRGVARSSGRVFQKVSKSLSAAVTNHALFARFVVRPLEFRRW